MKPFSIVVSFLVALLISCSLFPFFEDASAVSKQLALAVVGLFSFIGIFIRTNQQSDLKIDNSLKIFMVFISALAAITATQDFSLLAIDRLSLWFLLLLVLIWFRLGSETSNRAFVATSSIFMLVILTVWGWWQLISAMDGFTLSHQRSYEIVASLGHRNLLGQFIWVLILTSIPGIHLFSKFKWAIRVLMFLAALLTLLMLARSAWLIALSSIVGVFIYFKTSKLSMSQKQARLMYAGLGVALILFIFSLDGWYSIQHHFVSAFDFTEGTTRDRLLLAWRSIQMGNEHWLTGAGAGQWPILQMAFDQSGMSTESGEIVYMRPHNDFLWLYAEYGIFVALAYLSIFFIGILNAVRQLKTLRSMSNLAILLTWIALFIASVNNFPLERSEFLLALVALLGISASKTDKKLHFNVNFKLAFVLVFLASSYGVVYFALAKNQVHKALISIEKNEFEKAKMHFGEAKRLRLFMDEKALPIDWHLANLSLRQSDAKTALALFNAALKVNPNHPYIYNSIGAILAQDREPEGAKIYFETATQFAPKYADAWLNIALLQYSSGDFDAAFNSFLTAKCSSNLPLYKPLGTRLSVEKMTRLIPDFPERKLWKTIEAIRNTPDWSYQTLVKSCVNKNDFKEQAIIEACYYMFKHCDNETECAEVAAIKEKYIPEIDLNLEE